MKKQTIIILGLSLACLLLLVFVFANSKVDRMAKDDLAPPQEVIDPAHKFKRPEKVANPKKKPAPAKPAKKRKP